MTVAVFGALHHDILVEAPRLPRPGETLPGRRWYPKAGGKGGNQAVAAARHGAETAFIGAVGRDGFGAGLRARLRAAGVDTAHLREAEAASGLSVAILDPAGEYGAVIVSGANAALGPADAAAAAALLGRARVLLLQNEVPEAASLAAARIAREGGATVILNAAPARPLAPDWAGVLDLLLVNAVEAEMLGAGRVGSLAEAGAAARALLALAPAAIVTAGAAGAALAGRDGSSLALPALPVRAVSSHGAGDCFAGALAAALDGGLPLEAALPMAVAAAAAFVATPEAERDAPGPAGRAGLPGGLGEG